MFAELNQLLAAWQTRSDGGPLARVLVARLKWLWSYLASVRASDTELDNLWVPGLTIEEMAGWARRWDKA